ncbi:hypothetical protein Fcan01_20736 [Folsomia candida]|uniref:Uncharacterized protein n=1 Tax=Folsomia candida TaxID=158441 RepID=A0A226DFK5_FOLCA|nr:hypothetical protein Fcan01_20736 [Folsomia candida]
MSVLQCQSVQLLVYLYQDHYPFMYRWPLAVDKKTHKLTLLHDTRRGITLLRKLVPTLLMLIMGILSVLDVYLPLPHHGTPEENKIFRIKEDKGLMTSKFWITVFVATLQLSASVTAFYTFFHHFEDIIQGSNRILKLYNKFHPRCKFKFDTTFRAKLARIFYSIKTGDDVFGLVLNITIFSGWIIVPSLPLFLVILNFDPVLHAFLYISQNFGVMQATDSNFVMLPSGIFVLRLAIGMLTFYELARICCSTATLGVLWGEMELANILSVNRARGAFDQIKLYRQVWLCTYLMRWVHGNFLFLLLSGVGLLVVMSNFCTVRVAMVGKISLGVALCLIYGSVSMGALIQILVTLCTRRNEELSKVRNLIRSGGGMLGGIEGKIVRREVKSLRTGCVGISVPGAFFGHFNKYSKILVVNIIFSKTLDALIIYE